MLTTPETTRTQLPDTASTCHHHVAAWRSSSPHTLIKAQTLTALTTLTASRQQLLLLVLPSLLLLLLLLQLLPLLDRHRCY